MVPLLPYLLDFGDYIQHADSIEPTLPGNVCGRKKRLFLMGHNNGEGPSSGSGHHLAGVHVNLVDIRPFLTVNLDADKYLV